MKIDVTAAKGTEEEMMKSWQEEHHMQVVLYSNDNLICSNIKI